MLLNSADRSTSQRRNSFYRRFCDRGVRGVHFHTAGARAVYAVVGK